jgi:S1-C subfamily serine protease
MCSFDMDDFCVRRYYQILGLSPDATQEQIKEAYIFSLKAFHPDKFAGSSLEQQRIAHERTKAINEAYSVLSDPIKRANYDREYMRPPGAGPPRSSPPPPPESAPPPPPPASTEPFKRPELWNTFVGDYLHPRGRIGRATFIVKTGAIFGALALIAWLAASSNAEAVGGLFFLVCVALFAVQAGKRLHDINSSAGWVFAGVTGLGAIVLSLLLPFAPGTQGPNRFGPPLVASRRIKIAAVTICGLALLSLISLVVTESSKSQRDSSAGFTPAATSTNKITPMQSSLASLSPTPNSLTRFSGMQFNTSKIDLGSQPTPSQSRTVEGSEIHYSLAVAADWIVKPKQELSKEEAGDFDLIASHKTVYVAVIAEEPNLGDVDTVVGFSRKLLTQRGTDARLSKVETTSINGRNWRTFSAHITVEKIPFAYQFYVYTGPEGTFQLLGWTFENLFEREAPQIREVLQSFKFPPSKNYSNATIPPGEEKSPSERTVDDERAFDLPTLAKNTRPAVLLIVGFDASGKVAKSGSGFFISRGGRIVTNWHVVDGITSAAAKTEGGAIYKVTGVLAYSIHLDLAVLKAEGQNVPFLPVEKTETPEAGTKIAVIGSPLALEGTLSEGIVSAVRKEEKGTWIQITAPVSPGSSGSPVLNDRGRVIGVATLNSDGRYQNLNFARSSHDLAILIGSIPSGAPVQPFSQLASWNSSQNPTPSQAPSDSNVRRTAVVTAFDSKGLHLRSDHTAKSAIVATLHHGDQVFLEDGYFRNDEPPEPVAWQKVTTAAGDTGWIRADYVSVSDSSQ